jgi:hypothetical protein
VLPCPKFTFKLSIMSKWLTNHICTKVSFKFTIRDSHVYIEIPWPLMWYQYFYLGIWNDDRTNIIVLPSFQFAIRLNSQNRIESEFINELWLINLYMNICLSNWHFWIFNPTKMKFITLFQFLRLLLTSNHLNRIGT